MLSDAALAIAVDTDVKWLYNAARRLKRPLLRTNEGATWWRLTHHLSGRLGIQLADAARAADTLLAQGADLTRVRLRATLDDTVGVSVDLARFHDSAALGVAAALHLAVPRRRGRPRERSAGQSLLGGQAPRRLTGDPPIRLSHALASVVRPGGASSSLAAVQIASALAEAGVPFVITGGLASVYHGLSQDAGAIDLVADFGARHARSLSHVLNRLRAEPRGVSVRESFTYDSSLIRSAACLALRFEGFALNIERSVPGVGEFAQVREESDLIALERLSYRVLSRDAHSRAAAFAIEIRSTPGSGTGSR